MRMRLTDLPQATRFVIADARIPAVTAPGHGLAVSEGLVQADIVVAEGLIEAILPAGQAPAAMPVIDMQGGQVWPCFTDMHTHLDKGHIWGRNPNPDGSFDGALSTVQVDRETFWSADDVATRMDFSLRSAYAHGTKLIRTHLDSIAPQHRISFEVFDSMRARWKGRVDLQAAALFPLDLAGDTEFFKDLVATVTRYRGVMGGVTFLSPTLERDLDALFVAAMENGLDIDLHVDETQDREVLTLKTIAEAAIRHGFPGQVTVGHCCSLTQQDADTARHTIDLVARAGLAVVSLPMCNMYLQDRHPGRTPRQRGVTLLHELAAAGVQTAVSSDNTRDPFYAYGDLDPVEVFREAVRVLHLDHPIDTAARVITTSPSDIVGRGDVGRIAAGLPADLVLFSARHWSELLSRPQADRIVLRDGAAIDSTLPDYRELDTLKGL